MDLGEKSRILVAICEERKEGSCQLAVSDVGYDERDVGKEGQ